MVLDDCSIRTTSLLHTTRDSSGLVEGNTVAMFRAQQNAFDDAVGEFVMDAILGFRFWCLRPLDAQAGLYGDSRALLLDVGFCGFC